MCGKIFDEYNRKIKEIPISYMNGDKKPTPCNIDV